jgi:acetyl esterase
MITAEHDIFRVENEEYVKRLTSAGIPCVTAEYPGQMHGFFHLLGPMTDSRSAVNKLAIALRSALDGDYSAFQISKVASENSRSNN